MDSKRLLIIVEPPGILKILVKTKTLGSKIGTRTHQEDYPQILNLPRTTNVDVGCSVGLHSPLWRPERKGKSHSESNVLSSAVE